jgi:hypothetical protein
MLVVAVMTRMFRLEKILFTTALIEKSNGKHLRYDFSEAHLDITKLMEHRRSLTLYD